MDSTSDQISVNFSGAASPARHEKAFTYEYAQPLEYAFCQDSVLAPLAIANDLEKLLHGHASVPANSRNSGRTSYTDSSKAPRVALASWHVLDVCAGCGVMGFELYHALPELRTIDFLEIQDAFEPSFRENVSRVLADGQDGNELNESIRLDRSSDDQSTIPHSTFTWIQKPYSALQLPPFAGQYDLVICNPPYFDLGEGTLPQNLVKQRARFFLDDTLESLLTSLRSALKPEGRAYVLMKSGKKHGRDAFTLAQSLLSDCDIEKIADVRGTDLVRITKRA